MAHKRLPILSTSNIGVDKRIVNANVAKDHYCLWKGYNHISQDIADERFDPLYNEIVFKTPSLILPKKFVVGNKPNLPPSPGNYDWETFQKSKFYLENNRKLISRRTVSIFNKPNSNNVDEPDISVLTKGGRVGVQLKYKLGLFETNEQAFKYLFKRQERYGRNNIIHIDFNNAADYKRVCWLRDNKMLLPEGHFAREDGFFDSFVFEDASTWINYGLSDDEYLDLEVPGHENILLNLGELESRPLNERIKENSDYLIEFPDNKDLLDSKNIHFKEVKELIDDK